MTLLRKTLLILFVALFVHNLGAQNYPGFDIIGKGYNVFGEYANNKSVMHYNLFDFSKMSNRTNSFNHTVPSKVMITNISDHVITTIEGSSKKEYVNELSENAGLSGNAFFFKASVDHQIDQSSEESSSNFYYTYMDVNTKWRINLDVRNFDTLISYLDPQFKSDLANLPAEELFDLYGTHFISSAYLGGRIDYVTTTQMNEYTDKKDVKTAISAKYMAIKGNIEINDYSKHILSSVSTQTKLNVVGGNSEFTNNIHDNTQYKKWAEGISTAPVLSGFDKRSLKPIWLLTKDPKRQAELENYFNGTLLQKYPIPLFFAKDDILDNTHLTQNFNIHIDGFFVHQDCDNYLLTGDEAGDFIYDVRVYANDEFVKQFATKEGYVTPVWSGNWLELDEDVKISVPLVQGSKIKVWGKLIESDDVASDNLGTDSRLHKYPFAYNDLYNATPNDIPYYTISYYEASDCNATLYYRITATQNPAAVELGNKGWSEYEAGNYDQAQNYNKEALKLDNALWYVHYNIALNYLVQGNPRAFDKYKEVARLCPDRTIAGVALEDILSHEEKYDILPNSEMIKSWLRSIL